MINESSSKGTRIWYLNRTLRNLIPQMQTRSSWKRISHITLQLCGGFKESMSCFLDPNGMIFGMLSETGRLCLNAFTGILDQPTLQLWWGVFGMRCVTMILKPSCDFVMNFPRKWMRFIDSRAKRFLQTSILENLHLLAIARSVPPKTCSSSLQTQFQQPSNQQVFVNTTVSVAQR